MKIGIAGGTGGMGEGFVLRWCQKHDVIVGSRDAQKAREAAENYTRTAKQTYGGIAGSISGNDNISFGNDIDVLILSIPYEFIDDTCSKLADKLRDDCIVVSPIVPMARTEAGFVYIPLEQGKEQAAEMVADKLPPRSRVVSAFHTISESKLRNVQQSLDADTFICGDDQNTIAKLRVLVDEISGLRPVYLGPLALAYQAEILTPMCLNAAKRNKMKNPGIKLVWTQTLWAMKYGESFVSMRWKEEFGSRRGRNWMSAMGILFIVMAVIIMIRNLALFNVEHAAGLIEDGTQQFLDNFSNGEITNEKFAVAMIAGGGFLLYWGYFKKKEDYGPPDEHEWRRFNR